MSSEGEVEEPGWAVIPTFLRWLADRAAGLDPGSFAMVMATGILSSATYELGMLDVSLVLLAVACLSFALLLGLTVWRLLCYHDLLLRDLDSPDRAFGFFTFVAACNVLAARLHARQVVHPALELAIAGGVVWLLLSYVLPVKIIVAPAKAVPVGAVNGTWLIWVVGTQSVAVSIAVLTSARSALATTYVLIAVALWAFGVVLYLLLMGIILARLMLTEVRAEDLTPPYWITMGATAITVLAAGEILRVSERLPMSRAMVESIGFLLWAFGTWWIPLLLLLGVWRHVVRRVPFSYEPALWGMVFPLGMYATASNTFGHATGLVALEDVAKGEVWLGLAAWLGTFVVMVLAWVSGCLALRRRTARRGERTSSSP